MSESEILNAVRAVGEVLEKREDEFLLEAARRVVRERDRLREELDRLRSAGAATGVPQDATP